MLAALSCAFRSMLIQPSTPQVMQSMNRNRPTRSPLMRKIRRHKIKKLKRRKRIDRDFYQLKTRHMKKKTRAEALFRARMNEMLAEFRRFDPMDYVTETIHKAKRDWRVDVAPTGRKKYPHWSTLMSLEELYGLDPSEQHIDKRYGLPSAEERPMVDKLKEDYLRHYWVADPARLVAERRAKGMPKRLEAPAEEAKPKLSGEKGTPI